MTINEEKYTPVGIVEVEDFETGEIVYKTHNMIVQTGRKALLNRVCSNGTYDLRKFYEINHRAVTVPAMTIVNSRDYTDSALQCNEEEIFFDDPTNGKNLSEIVLESNSYELNTSAKTDRKLFIRITTNKGEANETTTDYEITRSDSDQYSGKAIYKRGLEEHIFIKHDPSDDEDVRLTDTLPDSEETYMESIGLMADNYVLVVKFEDSISVEDISKTFHICCSHPDANNPVKALTSVGLLIKKSESGVVNDLFSRATIDPVFMRPGRRYVMHYTLHF